MLYACRRDIHVCVKYHKVKSTRFVDIILSYFVACVPLSYTNPCRNPRKQPNLFISCKQIHDVESLMSPRVFNIFSFKAQVTVSNYRAWISGPRLGRSTNSSGSLGRNLSLHIVSPTTNLTNPHPTVFRINNPYQFSHFLGSGLKNVVSNCFQVLETQNIRHF